MLLGQQVTHSGVFYESHLLQWFEGRRSLEQMKQEPQVRIRAGTIEVVNANRPVELGAGMDAFIDERMLPLVQRQLDVLSSSTFSWHGLLWPGVEMHWEIREKHPQDAGNGRPESVAEQSISTRIRLELTVLGAIEICLNLSGDNGVEIYAWAEEERGANALRPATVTLEERLQHAGFNNASVALLSEPET